jgi:hypothetical protein
MINRLRNKEYYLLGCDVVYPGRSSSEFQWNSTGLHCITSQKNVLCMATVATASEPTMSKETRTVL